MEPVYREVQIWVKEGERIRLIAGRHYVKVERDGKEEEYEAPMLREIIKRLRDSGYRLGYSFMEREF